MNGNESRTKCGKRGERQQIFHYPLSTFHLKFVPLPPYEQKSQRNHQHPIHQYRFHDTGDCHLQALRTRSRAMAVLSASAEPFRVRLVQLFRHGGHSAIHRTHASLLRTRHQLYHQPQSALPAHQYTSGRPVYLSVSPLCDEQSGREQSSLAVQLS